MFRLLISISGIGPKIALGILSSVSIDDMIKMISSSDITAMTKLPGIGKKTAERVIVELKDKIQQFGEIETKVHINPKTGLANEAISALIALGYNKTVSEKCVNKVLKDTDGMDLSAELIIRNALKYAMS
jgi:Holliday junction DNA helicase RuvA